jgi:hypothetical protein
MIFEAEAWAPSANTISQALRYASRAAAVSPKCGDALALAGYLLLESGRPEKAIGPLRTAMRLEPGNVARAAAYLHALADAKQERALERAMAHAAPRFAINLDHVRRALEASGLPTDPCTLLAKAFPSKQWLRSDLERAGERVRVDREKAVAAALESEVRSDPGSVPPAQPARRRSRRAA